MRYRSRGYQGPGGDINLTPLIDLVFILLILFLVTASFVKESGIEVDNPTAHTSVRQERGNLVVSITAEGEFWIGGRQVERRLLRAEIGRLQAQNPEGTLIIAADRKARTDWLLEAMDQGRLAGVKRIALAADPGD